MSEVETQLRAALAGFMDATKRGGDTVGIALARIAELHRQLPASANPMLRHYLERRSYQKALDLLNAGQAGEKTRRDHGPTGA